MPVRISMGWECKNAFVSGAKKWNTPRKRYKREAQRQLWDSGEGLINRTTVLTCRSPVTENGKTLVWKFPNTLCGKKFSGTEFSLAGQWDPVKILLWWASRFTHFFFYWWWCPQCIMFATRKPTVWDIPCLLLLVVSLIFLWSNFPST